MLFKLTIRIRHLPNTRVIIGELHRIIYIIIAMFRLRSTKIKIRNIKIYYNKQNDFKIVAVGRSCGNAYIFLNKRVILEDLVFLFELRRRCFFPFEECL